MVPPFVINSFDSFFQKIDVLSLAEGDGKFVTLRFARARISRVVGCCRALHYAVSVDHGDDFWDTRNFTYNVSPECSKSSQRVAWHYLSPPGGDAKYSWYTNSGILYRNVKGRKVSQRQKLVNGTQICFLEDDLSRLSIRSIALQQSSHLSIPTELAP